jgi:polysaccharide biosynthesis protein PslH
MRFLFLTPQFPYPPQAGGPLRNYGLIDGLHAAGHRVDLLTFVEPGQPDPAATPLAGLCERIITVPAPSRSTRQRLRDLLLSAEADIARRFYSPDFAKALSGLLAAGCYDLVQIEGLEMAPYLPLVRAGNPAAKTVYDAHNAEFNLQHLIHRVDRRNLTRLPAALYSFLQWRRLTRLERAVCQQVDHVIAVSEADAEALHELVPTLQPDVVPNGIYTAEYTCLDKQLDLGPAALLFTGTMNYRPNVDAVLWFADEIMGVIREAVPEARLFIVGNKPHSRLDGVRQRDYIEVTGYVQDVTPFLHSATVYVAPLRMGSGTRLKLLQAMAAGCAIVSTSTGAEGLHVSSGREILLADTAARFARATVALLRDPAQRVQLGQAAQELVRQQYDWSVIVPRLLAVYQRMSLG